MIPMKQEERDRSTADQRSEPTVVEFNAIFKREYSYVTNSLRRLGIAESDLEDLAHEIFLAVHRRLSDYDASRPLRPWLFGIAFRVASDYRRLARHRREIGDPELDAVDNGPSPEEHASKRQAQELVIRGLATLDLDRRALLVMHDIDGVAVPEIASVLQIPVNTAYSRLRLARGDFASAIRMLQREKGGPQ